MKRVLSAILVVVGAASTSTSAQRLDDASIDAGIKCGLREVKCEEPVLKPTLRVMQNYLRVEITVLPPLGRIYRAAREAKIKYQSFTRQNVSEAMLAPVIEVRVRSTTTNMRETLNVLHLTVLPKGKKDGAAQPVEINDWNQDVQNLYGATLARVGKIASFAIKDLPPGELDVVMITDSYGELRATINKKDREKLDRWCGVVGIIQ